MPVSDKQLAANRANAQKSTGPRTPEGKSRSAQNSRKHGFNGVFAVVRLEELQDVDDLRADLIATYRPINSQELFAIESIALAQHAMRRASRLETGVFTSCLDNAINDDGVPFSPLAPEIVGNSEVTLAQNLNYAMANGLECITRRSDSFALFLRYKTQTERLYRRALEDFNRLKALRPELDPQFPNEPISDPQPEENTPVPAPPDEPVSPTSETSGNSLAPQDTSLENPCESCSRSLVGRTPWSAAGPLAGLLCLPTKADEGVGRRPGGPPHRPQKAMHFRPRLRAAAHAHSLSAPANIQDLQAGGAGGFACRSLSGANTPTG